jgi:prepilin-type N-terminal cleavage/methylation domain-containing protein
MSATPSIARVCGTRGFTLVEGLASLAIFGIVAGGLAANSISVMRYNHVSHTLSMATALAQDEIEQLRALDPSTNPAVLTVGTHQDANNPITSVGASGGRFTRSWTLTRDAPVPGIATVIVNVAWTDSVPHNVQLLTYYCQTTTCD